MTHHRLAASAFSHVARWWSLEGDDGPQDSGDARLPKRRVQSPAKTRSHGRFKHWASLPTTLRGQEPNSMAGKEVVLREGAQVMLVRNEGPEEGRMRAARWSICLTMILHSLY